ncbi:DUF1573 domain-containing protein [Aureibaculum sp. 2210JD6-5]|uniref:DUF1573 domain-containing protein n=1 Tax=Aureibaculum sp. 2210JD6-5 TaxID=3103957 RepID=UPI002AADA52B|nr:DUF1573 domain-containing protein [Aureibaculum sp. 2210JD6-5]MDY7393707.1 DUF1573 domain-containing protein [Aureibaculum sp. 2210JD6-5]
MKKLAVLLFIGCIGFSLNAQEDATVAKADPNAPKFKFETKTVDYGTIERNADGIRLLKFTNVGKSPLIISSAKSTCGCTVPSIPKEPIMPGESGEIAVKYDTNRVGQIAKSITITSNADRPKIVIPVRGTVKKESSLTKLEKHEKSIISSPEQ